ncbi:DNA-directed RNA polymerase subunit beta [Trinickia terrae]|uniref:DNA-directed RNA polymerase subunit beta n=1 Tax=Trinickia terrae TaxID=2571161 RepID=A0A4U1I136_9BURK|nr:inclusion body family protein [Trinickia terrae]TKC86857.1 DNA-directed RNA polymerase subunit beta [Trinickia terrae]
MADVSLAASTAHIQILAVIDTEYIKATSPNPSKDWKKPTGLAHIGQFLLVTGSRGVISGQGTADLEFRAYPGDLVSFTGTSIQDNSDDAVILYNIARYSGDEVFNPFQYNGVTRNGAVQPNLESPDRNGLPAVQRVESFASFDSRVRQSGREGFGISFGLYTLVGGQKQELFGYYWWDPYITVPA